MIAIRNISKTFYQTKEPFKALKDVSLKVTQGDIMGIIGFSGAGKSTLIRCVNLLEKPDEGQIIVNGTDLTKLSSHRLAKERKKIGMIFQHFNLLSSRTVFDNVAFPLELDHVNKADIRKKVNDLLAIVGLEDKADDYPRSLSGGQKQRVAIARALANDPYLLLCDEATSALDPATTQSILQLLRDINRRLNITILLITHEMEVVKAVCNHVTVIDKGSIVANGTLEQIFAQTRHPIIKQLITSEDLTFPPEFSNRLQKDPKEGLYPVIELQFNGNIPFGECISEINNRYRIPYELLKANVEYVGKANFGKAILYLKGNSQENKSVIQYFDQNNIQHTLRGYA